LARKLEFHRCEVQWINSLISKFIRRQQLPKENLPLVLKATRQFLQIQDKIKSTPTTSGNDVFPSPLSPPITQDEGAERIIDTIHALLHSLGRLVSPNDHALVKLLGQNISDCVDLYQEAHNRNIMLQQQLDDSNAKLLAQFEVQNAEILKLDDQIKKSQAVSDFCREQALKAGVVPTPAMSPPTM
jgi:hypothetical protein